MNTAVQVELCVEAIATVREAEIQGADRIELCSALDLGGLTPSWGLVRQSISVFSGEVYVMIRPRAGDFVYSAAELELMCNETTAYAKLGIHGVVVGALNGEGAVDTLACQKLMSIIKCSNIGAAFHRAFDSVPEVNEALNQLIDLGFDRGRTSGKSPRAIEGITTLQQLVNRSRGRIEIMAGGGINAEQTAELTRVGVDALHLSARVASGVSPGRNMGQKYLPNRDKIRRLMASLHREVPQDIGSNVHDDQL